MIDQGGGTVPQKRGGPEVLLCRECRAPMSLFYTGDIFGVGFCSPLYYCNASACKWFGVMVVAGIPAPPRPEEDPPQ